MNNNQSNASHQVVCDNCGQKLGEYSSSSSKGHISVSLPSQSKYSNDNSVNKEAFDRDSISEQHHACSESCLAEILTKRAKTKAKLLKTSKATVIEDGVMTLDITLASKKV
jgi:hypothetical protein